MNEDLKDLILSAFESSLDAQLRAVRRLRQGPSEEGRPARRKGLSHVNMAYDLLKRSRQPLHVSELLARIQKQFGL